MERGDYQVIGAKDYQIIIPSEFASAVEAETILEMSIILRQRTLFQENKCPRCDHINPNVTADSGWIEWKVLPSSYPF